MILSFKISFTIIKLNHEKFQITQISPRVEVVEVGNIDTYIIYHHFKQDTCIHSVKLCTGNPRRSILYTLLWVFFYVLFTAQYLYKIPSQAVFIILWNSENFLCSCPKMRTKVILKHIICQNIKDGTIYYNEYNINWTVVYILKYQNYFLLFCWLICVIRYDYLKLILYNFNNQTNQCKCFNLILIYFLWFNGFIKLSNLSNF